MIYKNEDVYEGGWYFGQKHGEGELTTGKGEIQKGYWVFDKKDGILKKEDVKDR